MKYYISKTIDQNYEEAIPKVTEALKNEGFGVLTEIDVKETLKNKIDVDFRKYIILGACNPSFAHQALQKEDKVGTMLPCNIIIHEKENGDVEVAAVDPMASMMAIENDDLRDIANEVKSRLTRVIESL